MNIIQDPAKGDKKKSYFYLFAAILLVMFSSVAIAVFKWSIGIIMFVLVFIGGSLYFIVKQHASDTTYRCPACGHQFKISPVRDFISPHTPEKKFLKCPRCLKRDWAKELAEINSKSTE